MLTVRCRLCRSLGGIFMKDTFSKQVQNTQRRHASLKNRSNSEFCLDMVRKCDYENFLCTLLLPGEARTSTFAIRAFNIEIAQIQDVVSNPQIGLMRIQFWKDALDNIYQGHPPLSPIALELAKAVKRHTLPKLWFTRILETRKEHIHERAFTYPYEVETYAENIFSSNLYLTMATLGIKDVEVDHACSHVGKAMGIVTLLRGVPHQAQRNKCLLPQEIMMQYNVSQEEVVRGCREQKLKDVIFDLASVAHQHMEKARALKDKLPSISKLGLLAGVPCDIYLKSLQKADFDIFHPHLQHRNSWLPAQLWWTKFRHKY